MQEQHEAFVKAKKELSVLSEINEASSYEEDLEEEYCKAFQQNSKKLKKRHEERKVVPTTRH